MTKARTDDLAQGSVFEPLAGRAPLAARMRPQTLDEVEGQQHLLGVGRALREALAKGQSGSFLLWGPPGSGKTTLARLAASNSQSEFVAFSAVTEGVPRLREIVAEAEKRLTMGQRTILFIDEIHRFNRGQQDALLPHVETGTVTLIGATTENPSFELNAALLSRLRVFVLQPLSTGDITELLRRAIADRERGLGAANVVVDDEALALLARESDGDARRALSVLEAAALLHLGSALAMQHGNVDVATMREALQLRFAHYDKSGEGHFNLISAYHKALRGSDPDAALYWLARMLQGGEDPMYIARRTVRFATEDIGLADPRALEIAIAARDAYQFLGTPEGELGLAEAAVYLATAPKSNRVYVAFKAALDAARTSPAAEVPTHLRNAVTPLMEELGYGKGYQYAHEVPEAHVRLDYLPDELAGSVYYQPSAFGFEEKITQRLQWWSDVRRRMRKE